MSSEPEESGPPIKEGAPKWVVTFGDLMSLLLCFFVLLLSFSETDKALYKEVAGSMREAFGVQRKHKVLDSIRGQKIIAKDFDQQVVPPFLREEIIATHLKKSIGEELKKSREPGSQDLDKLIKVESRENEISIRLMGESAFDSGKADMKPAMKAILKKIASVLNSNQGAIIIAGHTDNVPIKRGNYKTNLELSLGRAAAVAEFLINKADIPPKRISAQGYGKYRPRESNLTSKGRERNRRVEIILHLNRSFRDNRSEHL